MPLDNPTRILQALDTHLGSAVELTLIGKAALWLGFDDPPDDYGSTLDVDAVVPIADSAALDQNEGFWLALQRTNEQLRPLDLYLTHLFEESQIFLRPDWVMKRIRIQRPELRHIHLFRPDTLDLILTKMMRGADPGHMQEIQWMIRNDGLSRVSMLGCLEQARIPDDSAEWGELFNAARKVVLEMSYASD
jgi:hypothetical protein